MSKPNNVILYKVHDRVVLKENPKYKGKINQILQPYTAGDPYFYSVNWDNMGTAYMYLSEALISQSEFEKSEKFYASGDAKPPIT